MLQNFDNYSPGGFYFNDYFQKSLNYKRNALLEFINYFSSKKLTISQVQGLKLNEMLKANDVEDQTSHIRELKHSQKIKADVETMQRFKTKYQRLRQTNYNQYDQMMAKQCNFLFTINFL